MLRSSLALALCRRASDDEVDFGGKIVAGSDVARRWPRPPRAPPLVARRGRAGVFRQAGPLARRIVAVAGRGVSPCRDGTWAQQSLWKAIQPLGAWFLGIVAGVAHCFPPSGLAAALTIARIPALRASGRDGQAIMTACRSGVMGVELAFSAPDFAPRDSELSGFVGVLASVLTPMGSVWAFCRLAWADRVLLGQKPIWAAEGFVPVAARNDGKHG